MDTERHRRPRRARHDSAKHYDANRKDLELSEVLDVLQCYVDYGGGINCCVCGKLYKSRVCFIKHLWEHTIYWDLFAGDKNHMRVLSIQAALILYGTCQQPLRPIPVDNLLVTSPHSSEHGVDGKTTATEESGAESSMDEFNTPKKTSNASIRESSSGTIPMPAKPVKKSALPNFSDSTPVKKCVPAILRTAMKRKAPLKLQFEASSASLPVNFVQADNSPSPLMVDTALSFLHTPLKQKIPFSMPKTPKKNTNKKLVSHDTIHGCSGHRVRRLLIPATEVTSDDQCWKETHACSCKRKRSE